MQGTISNLILKFKCCLFKISKIGRHSGHAPTPQERAMKAEFEKEQIRCRDLEGQIRDMSRQLNDKEKEVKRHVQG